MNEQKKITEIQPFFTPSVRFCPQCWCAELKIHHSLFLNHNSKVLHYEDFFSHTIARASRLPRHHWSPAFTTFHSLHFSGSVLLDRALKMSTLWCHRRHWSLQWSSRASFSAGKAANRGRNTLFLPGQLLVPGGFAAQLRCANQFNAGLSIHLSFALNSLLSVPEIDTGAFESSDK